MDRLLNILRNRANTPRAEIATELGLTLEEVDAKITALEKDGIVLGYQAVVNDDKLEDAFVTAIIEIRLTPERGGGFDRLAQRIARFEQVESCYLMSGGYDLLVTVTGSDLKDVATFVAKKLSTLEGVLSTATHFQLKCYKRDGFVMDETIEARRLSVAP